MGFSEKSHAYIAARYYRLLVDRFGSRGERAFLHGTQYYAHQRGRRMAQRAIRDGEELTFDTYLRFGEWVNTEECTAMGCANDGATLATAPTYIRRITVCPWNTQFREMDALDAGRCYCRDLDSSICRGFNPELEYHVPQNLNQGVCCYHIVTDSGLGAGPWNKKREYLKGFDYHCAHSYWAYREVTEAIFGKDGTALAEQVLADFEAEYGAEMANVLRSYAHTNFNVCGDDFPDAQEAETDQ